MTTHEFDFEYDIDGGTLFTLECLVDVSLEPDFDTGEEYYVFDNLRYYALRWSEAGTIIREEVDTEADIILLSLHDIIMDYLEDGGEDDYINL